MIRFILKCSYKNPVNDLEDVSYYTIDNDLASLEKALKKGGSGENGYEFHSLIGAEIINQD